MSTPRSRLAAWSARIAFGIVSLLALIAGFTTYLRATAAPLHARPQDVASVLRSEPSSEWTDAVSRARQQLREGLVRQNLPGVSVAVGVDGKVVWAEGFGWADVEQRAPVTPESRFRIGSASTMLTAAAVGRLIEQGRLGLDQSIQTYVPAFSKAQWPVTLRQIMGEVGGVATDAHDNGEGSEGPLFRQRCERPVEALRHVANGPLLFEPGTRYQPSSYGWILVSAAVESAADAPFLTFMREQIFQPLAMNGTGAESATEENPEHIGEPAEDAPPITFVRQMILEPLGIVARTAPVSPTGAEIATFYVPGRGDVESRFRRGALPVRPHNLSCYAGARAFFSTPSDLVRFGQAINAGALLQPTTMEALLTSPPLTSLPLTSSARTSPPVTSAPSNGQPTTQSNGQSAAPSGARATGHGLGWNVRTVTLSGQPARAIVHDSAWPDANIVTLMAFRDRGLVVAVVSNMSSADTSALALNVANSFDAHIPRK